MTETNGDYLDRIVDEQALSAYLTDVLGEVDQYEIGYHGEGHSNETLFVTWGDEELVVRRPPPGETADTAHDVLREYRVIDALQGTDVRVPETVSACEDHSVLGCDFYVMKRVEGDVIRHEEPDRFGTPAVRRAVGEELVRGLAEIHAIDPEAVGLGEFGYPDGYTERQVERWHKQYDWAFEVTEDVRTVPAVETVGEWLEDNVPDSYPHTLVHGDYKLDNVVFGPEDPPELEAVLDWELSTLGDPFTDLGWMLAYWWDEKDPVLPDYELHPTFLTGEGYPTRTKLVEQYESITGTEFENARFYRALAVFKNGALGEMFFRRHLEGNSNDPLYPKMEETVPEMANRAKRIIEGDEPL